MMGNHCCGSLVWSNCFCQTGDIFRPNYAIALVCTALLCWQLSDKNQTAISTWQRVVAIKIFCQVRCFVLLRDLDLFSIETLISYFILALVWPIFFIQFLLKFLGKSVDTPLSLILTQTSLLRTGRMYAAGLRTSPHHGLSCKTEEAAENLPVSIFLRTLLFCWKASDLDL